MHAYVAPCSEIEPVTVIVLRPVAEDAVVTVPYLSHDAVRDAAARALATERGVHVDADSLVVVLRRDAHMDAELEAAPEVVTYEHVPADSPALVAFHAALEKLV